MGAHHNHIGAARLRSFQNALAHTALVLNALLRLNPEGANNRGGRIWRFCG